MLEVNETEEMAMFAAMNAYEVAVIAFTNPSKVVHENNQESVILTSKGSYIWAGAVAYALIHRPDLTPEILREYLRAAIARVGKDYAFQVINNPFGGYDNAVNVVRAFFAEAGFDRLAFEDACARTQDAIRTLEWLGIIEDPSWKKIGAIALAVYALAGPVQFTEAGVKDFKDKIATWQTTVEDGEKSRLAYNLKVERTAHVVKTEVVEVLGNVIDETASVVSNEQISIEELQRLLHDRRYYDGPINGVALYPTWSALKQFQQDRGLKVTGHPDPDTVRALRASRRWW